MKDEVEEKYKNKGDKKWLWSASEHSPYIRLEEWARVYYKHSILDLEREKVDREGKKSKESEFKENKNAKEVMSLSASAKYVPQLRVSLISRIRFQDRFAEGRLKLSLELISSHLIPQDCIKEQMETDHKLLSLLNNLEDLLSLFFRDLVTG